MDLQLLGEYVKMARSDRGLNQQELAEALKISRSTISDIERGLNRDYGIRLIIALCKYLKINFKIHYAPLTEDDIEILNHFEQE